MCFRLRCGWGRWHHATFMPIWSHDRIVGVMLVRNLRWFRLGLVIRKSEVS